MYQPQMLQETGIPLPPSSYHLFLTSLPQIPLPRLLCLPGVKYFLREVGRKVGSQLGVVGILLLYGKGL